MFMRRVVQADHVKQPEQWKLVEDARVIYSAGFFITVSPEAIALTAQHCAAHDKIYCMNISDPFLCQVCAHTGCLYGRPLSKD